MGFENSNLDWPNEPDAPPSIGSPSTYLLAGSLVALVAVRLSVALSHNVFGDEALYAWLSTSAPLTFTPHPPGTPFLLRTGMALLGHNEAGARFFFFALSLATLLFVHRLAREVIGENLAGWGTIAVACVPAYTAMGTVATPDGPQLFFWAVALLCTWRALQTDGAGWWLASGVTVGSGLFNKYILILYFPSLALCLLLLPAWRQRLRSRGPYLAVAAAFLVFVPVAAWCNSQEGWASLRYHLRDRQALAASPLASELKYQSIHMTIYSPLLYVGSLMAMCWAGLRGFRRQDTGLTFLFSFSIVPYLFFAVIAAITQRRLSREQWDAMAYVPALLAAVKMVGDYYSPLNGRTLPRLAGAALIVGAFTTALAPIECYTGWVSRTLGTPGAQNMIGWKELADAVDRGLSNRVNRRSHFVVGNTFSPALQYLFYGRATRRVYTLEDPKIEQYGLAANLRNCKMTKDSLWREAGHEGLFIFEEYPDQSGAFSIPVAWLRYRLGPLFTHTEELPPLNIATYGRITKRFRLVRCLRALELPVEKLHGDHRPKTKHGLPFIWLGSKGCSFQTTVPHSGRLRVTAEISFGFGVTNVTAPFLRIRTSSGLCRDAVARFGVFEFEFPVSPGPIHLQLAPQDSPGFLRLHPNLRPAAPVGLSNLKLSIIE